MAALPESIAACQKCPLNANRFKRFNSVGNITSQTHIIKIFMVFVVFCNYYKNKLLKETPQPVTVIKNIFQKK